MYVIKSAKTNKYLDLRCRGIRWVSSAEEAYPFRSKFAAKDHLDGCKESKCYLEASPLSVLKLEA